MLVITGSIVLYKNNPEILLKAINSFIKSDFQPYLFLIDNSPEDSLRVLENNIKVEYIHNPRNIGFGAGHNIAINKSINMKSSFHFIINPDIIFDASILRKMIDCVQEDEQIGMLMPKILNFDGTTQYLPKLLPSPLDILIRKLPFNFAFKNNFLDKYELRRLNDDKIINIPLLSGCFLLINMDNVSKVGYFDDRYFMYFEDWDLSRRVGTLFKTVYLPTVKVYHGYQSGANKSLRLFFIYVKSAIKFFSKWGWFIDRERTRINNEILDKYYE